MEPKSKATGKQKEKSQKPDQKSTKNKKELSSKNRPWTILNITFPDIFELQISHARTSDFLKLP